MYILNARDEYFCQYNLVLKNIYMVLYEKQ